MIQNLLIGNLGVELVYLNISFNQAEDALIHIPKTEDTEE